MARRILHIQMQEEKILFLRPGIHLKQRCKRQGKWWSSHPKISHLKFLGNNFVRGFEIALQKVKESQLSCDVNVLFSCKGKEKTFSYHSEMTK